MILSNLVIENYDLIRKETKNILDRYQYCSKNLMKTHDKSEIPYSVKILKDLNLVDHLRSHIRSEYISMILTESFERIPLFKVAFATAGHPFAFLSRHFIQSICFHNSERKCCYWPVSQGRPGTVGARRVFGNSKLRFDFPQTPVLVLLNVPLYSTTKH